MKREFINAAKRIVSQIVERSKELQPNEVLIVKATAAGCEVITAQRVTALIDEQGNVIEATEENSLQFAHPSKRSEVERAIQDAEHIEFIKS